MKESQPKLVSFCIPCKDRLEFIKQALPVNLEHNRRDQADVEFVLVDFASTDGLSDWVSQNFSEELKSGYLKLFYTEGLPKFHACIAKNTAHAFGSGKILTNLDADNFTGPRGGRYVYKTLKMHNFNAILHQFSGIWRDGTCGRLSYMREHFKGVAGYNEAFEPFTHQEFDIIGRMGGKYSIDVKYGLDSVIDRLIYRKYKKLKSHPKYNGAIISPPGGGEQVRIDMEKINRPRSDKDIAEGRFVANGGTFGITENVMRWVDDKFVPCEPPL